MVVVVAEWSVLPSSCLFSFLLFSESIENYTYVKIGNFLTKGVLQRGDGFGIEL